MNRKTLGWSAAAAVFADGYGQLALLGYKLVGADQLVGGPWPVRPLLPPYQPSPSVLVVTTPENVDWIPWPSGLTR